jgi:hypothetical protein
MIHDYRASEERVTTLLEAFLTLARARAH